MVKNETSTSIRRPVDRVFAFVRHAGRAFKQQSRSARRFAGKPTILLLLMAVVVSACAPGLASAPTETATALSIPTISIQPAETLIDEPVLIRLSGFEPNQEVTVRAMTVGTAFPDFVDKGKVYESFATFRTDAQGVVDLATQAPLSGSYNIVDGMGLFWSMTEKPTQSGSMAADPAPALLNAVQYRYRFTAEVNGTPVAESEMVQNLGSASVVVKDVAENGVYGQFYLPAGKGPFPAVIMLGGSARGGVLQKPPKAISAHGYAVLALAYVEYTSPVDGTSLAIELNLTPVEYFGKAIQWLQSQSTVDPGRIGLIGWSSGAMAALLVGATYPEIKTVIAFSPATLVLESSTGVSNFSYQGEPLPFVYWYKVPSPDTASYKEDPMSALAAVVKRIKADPELAAAIIPVERINGSVLLISGDQDSQWPGPVYGEVAFDRLKANNFAFPYRHIINPGAGHLIDFPYARRSQEVLDGGGSPQANAQAAAAVWPVVLDYLAAMK
jgi:dienelactone hydrolase